MLSISQTQIALYLDDYNNLIHSMLKYPTEQPLTLFFLYLKKNNRLEHATEEYYKRMLNIAYIYTKMKSFSIAEDYTLKQKNNFIDNNNLDLSFLDSKITGDRSSISNKRLLQMLRDGFHHSTSGNELYKISPNGRYIEFSFQKPNPIKIKLSLEDLSSLANIIGKEAQTFQFFNIIRPEVATTKDLIENLHLSRHYFSKKVDYQIMNSILQNLHDNNYNGALSEAETLIDKATEQEISLSQEQINRIINDIDNTISKKIITLEDLKENTRDLTMVFLKKELPMPILKIINYQLDSYVIDIMLKHPIFSYEDMYKIFTKTFSNETNNNDNTYKYFFSKLYYVNENKKIAYSSLLFAEYILSNFKPEDDFITIGNNTFEYKKLRNSLVHGRWHIKDDNIAFYDTKPNVENELDYNWSIELDQNDLYKYCKNMLNDKLQNEKPKQKQKTILEIKN